MISAYARLAGRPEPVFQKIKDYKPKAIRFSQLPDWLPVFGDKTFRGDCPLESYEQKMFFKYLRTAHPRTWGILGCHIKNENKRSEGQAQYDHSMGLVKGTADIIIIARVPFVCEMKRQDPTKGSFSPESIQYLEAAHKSGAFTCVALGFDGALAALNAWLANDH